MNKISILLNELKEVVWADRSLRRVVEDAGIKVSPCNYYSGIPSLAEIENSFEYSDGFQDKPPYCDSDIFSSPEESRQLLEAIVDYSDEFQPPEDGNEESPERFFWKNSQYSHSDAMSYYALLRHIKPGKIIEIGSGFSTLVAAEAVDKNGVGHITCIEPYPRKFLQRMKQIDLIERPAQEITVDWLNNNLNDGDVLFIDSTHTVKTGSDCLHIYLRLLPKIKRNIYVHVHDIFLPFGLPEQWLADLHIYWTEQYLLLGFLLDNPKVQFLYGSAYHQWANKELLEKFMHGRAKAGGGSFWFKYCGSDLLG